MHLRASLMVGSIMVGRPSPLPLEPLPTPVLEWTSTPTENPATIVATVAGWQPGDILEWQLSASLSFDELGDEDAGAVIGDEFTVQTEPLEAGTYYVRARLLRGAAEGEWSEVVELTIAASLFVDAFTYPNGTLLEDTGKWEHVGGVMTVSSNRLATPSSTLISLYRPIGLDLSGADSYYAQLQRIGAGNSLNLWAVVRALSTADFIGVRFSTNWQIIKRSGNTETLLAQAAGTNTGAEVFRLVDDTVADTISLYLDGVLAVGPVSAAGFNAGVKMAGVSVRVSGGYTADNFEAGSL